MKSAKSSSLKTFQFQVNSGGWLALLVIVVIAFWGGMATAQAQMPQLLEAYPVDGVTITDAEVEAVKNCAKPVMGRVLPESMPTNTTELRQMWQGGQGKEMIKKLASSTVRDELEKCVRTNVSEGVIDKVGSGKLHEELGEIKTKLGQCMQTCMSSTKPNFSNKEALSTLKTQFEACMKTNCPDVELPERFMNMAKDPAMMGVSTMRKSDGRIGKTGFWGSFGR